MRGANTWVDWAVLALCTAAALGAVFFGVIALDAAPGLRSVHGRAPTGALALIAGLTLINCSFLIGAAACAARRQIRLGRR